MNQQHSIDMLSTSTSKVLMPSRSFVIPLYASVEDLIAGGVPESEITLVGDDYVIHYSKMNPPKHRSRRQGSNRRWKDLLHWSTTHAKKDLPYPRLDRTIVARFDIGDNSFYGFIPSLQLPYLVGDTGENGKFNYFGPSDVFKGNEEEFVPPENLDVLIGSCVKRMLPIIRPELSLVNSIIELKDFLTLKHSVKNTIKLLKNIHSIGSFWKFKSLRELARVAADWYLQYKFNLQPLLSDIAGIHRSLSEGLEKVRSLIADEGRSKRRNYQIPITEFIDDQDETYSYIRYESVYGPDGYVGIKIPYTVSRQVRYTTTDLHVEMIYNYNYTSFQRAHALGLGLLDSLGVNINPQIIWNAIPWSFVVDWVANVGKFLSTFTVHLLDPKINISHFLYTVKRQRNIYVSAVYRPLPPEFPESSHVPREIFWPVVVETCYYRNSAMITRSLLETSGLDLDELSLGAALVLSRRKHHHHRARR